MRVFRFNVWVRIAAVLLFALLHYLLAVYTTFNIGQIRISIDQLPILLLAILFGPLESAVAALLGGFFYQVQMYGMQWMLFPWLLSSVVRGVIVGLGCRYLTRRNDDRPWKKPVQFIALLCFAAIVTTIVNTAVIGLEAGIKGILTVEMMFDNFYTRLFLSTVISILVGLTLPPIANAAERRFFSEKHSGSGRHEQAY